MPVLCLFPSGRSDVCSITRTDCLCVRRGIWHKLWCIMLPRFVRWWGSQTPPLHRLEPLAAHCIATERSTNFNQHTP